MSKAAQKPAANGSGKRKEPDAPEAITAADLLLRQALRKSVVAAAAALPQPPTLPFLPAPPNPLTLPAPFVIPPSGGRPARPLIVSTEELVENLAPKLTREEELYAISLTDLVKSTLGPKGMDKMVRLPDPSAELARGACRLTCAPAADRLCQRRRHHHE